MKKNKKHYKKNEIFLKISFVLSIIILLISFILDLIYINAKILFDPNLIGWAIAIVFPISILTETIATLLISLNKDKVYGIDFSVFQRLRNTVEYSVPLLKAWVALVVFGLLFIICLALHLFISTSTLLCVLFYWNVIFIITELPLLSGDKNKTDTILSLCMKRVLYLNPSIDFNHKDFKNVVSCITITQGINDTIKILNKNDINTSLDIFKYVMNNLTEILTEINYKNDNKELFDLYNNILKQINILELNTIIDYKNLDNNDLLIQSNLVIRILLLLKDKQYNQQNITLFEQYFRSLFSILISNSSDEIKNFVMIIIQRLIIYSVYRRNLNFLNFTLEQLNDKSFFYSKNKYILILIININIFIKYIIYYEKTIDANLKAKIKNWYNKEETIKEYNKIVNLETLINNIKKYTANPFVLLPNIIKYFNMWDWEFVISNEFKKEVITNQFVIHHFIMFLIQSKYIYRISANDLDVLDDYTKTYVYSYTKEIFTQSNKLNKDYFYPNNNSYPSLDVSTYEEGTFAPLLEYKKTMDAQYAKEIVKAEKSISNYEYSNPIILKMKDILFKKFGYNKNLEITNEISKTLNFLIEKDPTCVNSQEVWGEMIADNIISEIKMLASPKFEEIEINNLNNNFEKLKNANVNAISAYLKWKLFDERSNELNEEFKAYINSLNEIEYLDIIPELVILRQECYKFNIEFDNFTTNKPSQDQLNETLNSCEKNGDFYLYQGVSWSYDEIIEKLENHYFELEIKYKIEIECDKNYCFRITENESNNEDN